MSKHIDAEAFKRRILSYGIVHEGDRIPIPFFKHYFADAFVAMLRWVCEEVDGTPAADVAEVRHGRWLYDDGAMHRCSVCGEYSCCRSPYCGECGARMDEGEQNG